MTSGARTAVAVFGGLALILFETGFLASAFPPLSFLPLTFGVGAFLIQSRGWRPGAWFLVGQGLFLDLTGLGAAPLETLAYAAAALVILGLSRRLFSNRSLYGILGIGAAAWLAQVFVETISWSIHGAGGLPLPWAAYATWQLWRLGLLLALLVALFYAVPRRKRF